MTDKVSNLSDYVTAVEHDRAHNERRVEIRREADRIDRLRLDCDDLRVIVIGKTGANGLSSKVAFLTGAITRFERLLWILGGLLVSTIVGVVVRAWPG
jgi:hypothetical protein